MTMYQDKYLRLLDMFAKKFAKGFALNVRKCFI